MSKKKETRKGKSSPKKTASTVRNPVTGKVIHVPKSKAREYPGQKCEICGTPWVKGKRVILHHLSYDPEITALTCWACHSWMSGTAQVWKHPFKRLYEKRSVAPYAFALAVVRLYDSKVTIPAAQEAAVMEAVNRMAEKAWDKKETVN